MYSQQSFQPVNTVTSQYNAQQQRAFQPTGYVQSFYNPNPSGTAFAAASQFQGGGQTGVAANPQSYDPNNYAAGQQTHGFGRAADSSQWSQQGMGAQFGMGTQGISSTWQHNAPLNLQQNQQNFAQQANPQAYHAANYRGNQAGHDGVNAQPNAFNNMATRSGGMGLQAQPQPYQTQNWQAQPQYQAQGQQQPPQAYHAAHYRGNQQGHDQYLGDSSRPAQAQWHAGANAYGSGMNQSGF